MASVNKLFRTLGQICVLGVIAAGPWRNGALDADCLQFLLWGIVASGILALATLWTSPIHERKKNSYFPTILAALPLTFGLALCCLQIVPLSDSALSRLSPHILELKQTLLPADYEISSSDLKESGTEERLRVRLQEDGTKALVHDFLEQSFPIDSSFDMEKALILDQAVENDFVTASEKHSLGLWGSCISAYPLATRTGIPLFWGAIVLFFSVSILFNTSKSRVFLFKCVAIIGFVYALLCIWMRANPEGAQEGVLKSLWDNLLIQGEYGTYVNRNSSAGYLVLTLGACVFLFAQEFLQAAIHVNKERLRFEKENAEIVADSPYKRRKIPRWKTFMGDLFDLFNRRLFFWTFVTAVILASVFMSLSRGASLAASSVFIVTCIFLGGKKEARRYAYVWIALVAVSVTIVVATSVYERVDARMSTLVDEDDEGLTALQKDSRWGNWQGALKTSKDYPWFGTGLGTYSVANRPNDVALKGGRLFYYAENSYVQTLLEMGRLGLGLLVLEYLLLFVLIGRLLFGRHSVETFALTVATLAVIVGQLVAAFGDFGIYFPANLFLFTTLCSIALCRQSKREWESLNAALASKKTAQEAIKKMDLLKRREFAGLSIVSLMLLSLLLGSSWCLSENADSVARERLLKNSVITDEVAFLSVDALNSVVKEFEEFIATRDDSWEIRYELGELRLAQFRLQVLDLLKQERPKESERSLWQDSAISYFLEPLLKYQRINFAVPVATIRERKDVSTFLPKATHDFAVARLICPLFVNVNQELISLIPLVTNLSWGEERFLMELYARRMIAFSPYYSEEIFRNGCYLASFELSELQTLFLHKTLTLSDKYLDLAINVLAVSFPAAKLEDAVNKTLPTNPVIACKAMRLARGWTKTTPLYIAIKNKVERIFEDMPIEERNLEYYYNLASVYDYLEEYELADESLCKALEISPYDQVCCLKRARMLIKNARILDKDEECLKFIQDVFPHMRGIYRWEFEKLAQTAEKRAQDARILREAQDRVRAEQRMMQSAWENDDDLDLDAGETTLNDNDSVLPNLVE